MAGIIGRKKISAGQTMFEALAIWIAYDLNYGGRAWTDQRRELLHQNVMKFDTVYNTLAA